jgi:acyl carrier protein phosphodiesterase
LVLLKSKYGLRTFRFGWFLNFQNVCAMNYLAHARLSFHQPEVLVGNMISDFVKGRKQFDYPAIVQKGIRLHRAIDLFTDTHDATRQLKLFFRPAYRLYAGAFSDVVYDHFLANDPSEFISDLELKRFSADTYQVLEAHFGLLPPRFQQMLPFMRSQDWLYHYRQRPGIEKSFVGLARRAAYITETTTAYSLFNTHYEEMKTCYQDFFPDLKRFSMRHLQHLLNP